MFDWPVRQAGSLVRALSTANGGRSGPGIDPGVSFSPPTACTGGGWKRVYGFSYLIDRGAGVHLMVVADGAMRARCGTPLSDSHRGQLRDPARKASLPRMPRGSPRPRPHSEQTRVWSVYTATNGWPLPPGSIAALQAWRDREHWRVIEAVTGAGRTRVALVAIEEQVKSGGRAAVVVPTIELQPHSWKQIHRKGQRDAWPADADRRN